MRSSKAGSASGFTLVELTVVGAVMVIVATLAIPNIMTAVANVRLRSAANSIASVLQATRMAAIRANRPISAHEITENGATILYADTSQPYGSFQGIEPRASFVNPLAFFTSAPSVQFSGGEPTIHPQFLEILRMTREMGFTHIQAATNGIRFAELEFAQAAKEAGLQTLYLQFDGVCDDVYKRTRGKSLMDLKLQAIENCRKAALKIVFVPTIVKGVNDHQVGDIVKLALENIDCMSGISFQPVAFTGRINRRELEAKRYTLSDLAHDVARQTRITDTYRDWFPLSCVAPVSKLISSLRGEETTTLTSHPHCSMGTYLFVDQETKTAVPAPRFLDIPGLLQDMDELSRKTNRSVFKLFTGVGAWNSLHKHFKAEFAPPGLSFNRFLQTLQGMTDKKYGRNGMDGRYTYRTLMVAGMHFMDAYNYDVNRVKRCVIHYAAPNGLLYPFCTYNSGPVFREKIEKKYSIPLTEYEGRKVSGNGVKPACGSCGLDALAKGEA